MSLSAEYFHTAQRSGRCRVEKTSSNDQQGAFNPVLYDPIPQFAIEHIWLPKSMEEPLRAVASGEDSPELAASLVAPLSSLRRALLSSPSTNGNELPRRLLDRLIFLEPGADVAAVVTESCPAVNNEDLLLATLTELVLCFECHKKLVARVQ